jgi:type IV pilus assembly protein PilY1
MIKDPEIITRSFGYNDHEIPATIKISDLYDFTDNPYGNLTSSQAKESLDIAVSKKSGWYVNYVGGGEKSVSTATVVSGVAYFNSFTPADNSNTNQCSLSAGVGKLYAVDLATGSTVYKWRTLDVGDRVPDTPTIVIPPLPPTEDTNGDGIIDENDQSETGKPIFVGVGSGADVDGDPGKGTITLCDAVDCDPVEGIKLETMRTHLYIKE